MKKIQLCLLSTLLFLTSSIEAFSQNTESKFVDGKLFVRIKNQSTEFFNDYKGATGAIVHKDIDNLIDAFGITKIYRPFERYKYIECKKTYVFEFKKSEMTKELILQLEKLNYIEYANQVPVGQLTITPNDPNFHSGSVHAENWHLKKIGAEAAWNLNTGNPSVVIAVIDNEIDWQHPDLINSIFINPGEFGGVANFDDDGNGLDDDINGWDFSDTDNNTTGNNFLDHGTHCAGLASASTNNSTGISSIGYSCSVLPLKIASNFQISSNSVDIIAGIDAIYYADLMGVEVISCSWGTTTNDPSLSAAVASVTAPGDLVFVAAAGNSNDSIPLFPAAYPNVIAVAATDFDDTKSTFSNYGAWVDVSAPGTNIFSTNTRLVYNTVNGYSYKSGTSMATPIVAGLCGLILTQNPTFTATQVEACLENTATDIYPVNPTFIGDLGAGRIDAPAAVFCASNSNAFASTSTPNLCTGQTGNFSGFSNASGTLTWNWTFSPAPSSSTGTGTQFATASWNTPGTVEVVLTVFDGVNTYTYNDTSFVIVGGLGATFSSPSTFDLCNGSSQSLIVGFDNGTPPFTYTITNGYTTETFSTTTYTDYFYFYADPNYPNYTITSIIDNNSCTNTTNPSIALNIIPCCSNLIANGDFEQGNILFGSDNVIQCTTPLGTDVEGAATVFDVNPALSPNTFLGCNAGVNTTPALNIRNAVFGVNCRKGNNPNTNITLVPLPFPTPAAVPGYTSRLWFQQNVNITNNDTFNIDFHTTGSMGGNVPLNLPFLMRLEITDGSTILFSSGTFSVPAPNNNWHQFSYQWSNTTGYSGPVEVRLLQDTYFEGAFYDITFDDISIRQIDIGPNDGGAYAGQDITVCAGEIFQLSGSGGPTYSWTPTTVSNPNIAQPTTSISTTTSFVLATNNACGASTDTVLVTALPAPFVTISASATTICAGSSVTLTAPGGLSSYLWSTGATTNSITVSPTDTTEYIFTGTGSNGCSLNDTITIIVNPIPTVTISVLNDTICVGQTITLNGSGTANPGSYFWTPGFIGGTSYTVTPAITTTYVLHGSLNGCNNSDTVTIVVIPTPTVSVNNATICSGGTATLTATPSVGGGTYSWTPGGFTTQTIIVNPTTTTTYTVTYSIGGCSATGNGTVTVGSSLTVNVNSDTICSGATTTLTATPSSGGGTYSWLPTGDTTQTITVSPISTTTYTVTYTIGACTATASGTVIVNPTPNVTVANDTICAGGLATLTAIPSTPGGTYLWTPGSFTTQTITGSPSSTVTLTVVYTLNGCTASASGTVFVNPQPKVTVANDTICAGGTATLTANPGPPGGTFLWSPTGDTTQTITVSPATTTTYTVTYTLNGCVATGSGTVFVTPAPTVTVNNSTICAGGSASLTASPSILGGSYLWSPTLLTTQTITVNPATTTVYTVTYTLGACITTASGTVTVNPIPVISSIIASPALACPGSSDTITVTTTGTSFLWTASPLPNPVPNNLSYIIVSPLVTTTYTVIVSDVNGCTNSGSIVLTIAPNTCTSANIISTATSFSGSTNLGFGAPADIAINADVTLTGGVNTINCNDVRIAPGKKIIVKSGATLFISDAWLHGCATCNGALWGGIEAEHGSFIFINNNSLIEDAKYAIRTVNPSLSTSIPSFRIRNTIFNKNEYDICIADPSNSDFTPSTANAVANCVFTCRNVPTVISAANFTSIKNATYNNTGLYPTTLLLNGGARSKAGFAILAPLLNTNGYDIGVAGTTAANGAGLINVFDNHDMGIYVEKGGNYIVHNNKFLNIKGHSSGTYTPFIAPTGSAISLSNGQINQFLYVGGGASASVANAQNSFVNCNRAVSVQGYDLVSIYNSTVTNTSTSALANFTTLGQWNGQYGFYIAPQGLSNGSIQINGNTITNAAYGIHINRSIFYSGINYRIECNTINAAGTATQYLYRGLWLQDAIGSSTGMPLYGINVRFNTITHATNKAILAENIKRGLDISCNGELSVLYNTAVLIYPNTRDVIRIGNCSGVKIEANPAIKTSAGNTLIGNSGITGIYIDNSSASGTGNIINNNKTTYLGSCFVWQGANISSTQFRGNSMTRSINGLYLFTAASFNPIGSLLFSSGNRWGLSPTYLTNQTNNNSGLNPNTNAQINVRAGSGSGTFTGVPTLHVGIPAYTTGPGIGNGIRTSLFGTEPSFASCLSTSCGGSLPASALNNDTLPESDSDIELKTDVKELMYYTFDTTSIPFFDAQRKWYNQKSVFEVIQNEPDMLFPAELMSYYYDQELNFKKLTEIENLIVNGKATEAIEQLNLFTPLNEIEENLKFVYTLLLSVNSGKTIDLNGQEITQLFAIANMCSNESGPAVYKARSVYNAIIKGAAVFEENCKTNEEMTALVMDQKLNNVVFDLYPNPNNGKMTISYNFSENQNAEFVAYDLTGKVVLRTRINTSSHSMSISSADLMTGVYFYHVIADGEIVVKSRFVVTR